MVTVLSAGVSGPNIELSWTTDVGGITEWRVHRSEVSGGPYDVIATLAGKAVWFSDQYATPGIRYFYLVSAWDAYGVALDTSNEADAVVLGGECTPGETHLLTCPSGWVITDYVCNEYGLWEHTGEVCPTEPPPEVPDYTLYYVLAGVVVAGAALFLAFRFRR